MKMFLWLILGLCLFFIISVFVLIIQFELQKRKDSKIIKEKLRDK